MFSKKRSKWKGPYTQVIEDVEKVYKRFMLIMPQFVGKTFKVRARWGSNGASPHAGEFTIRSFLRSREPTSSIEALADAM